MKLLLGISLVTLLFLGQSGAAIKPLGPDGGDVNCSQACGAHGSCGPTTCSAGWVGSCYCDPTPVCTCVQ